MLSLALRAYREHTVLRWVLVFLLLLDAAAVLASAFAPSVDVTVDRAATRAQAGYAVGYTVKGEDWFPFFPYYVRSDGDIGSVASGLVLREDGLVLGPAHSQAGQVETGGMGAYSHWGRTLVFSSSDGSDPRTNGRTYTISYHPVVAPWLALALICANAIFLLLLFRRYLWSAIRRLAVRRRRWRSYALAASVPTAISALLLAYLPPTWNETDSAIFFFWRLQQVPHYPPLYPLLMEVVVRLFGPSASTITAVQLVQHLLLILGVAYLASSRTRPTSILIMSISAALAVALNLYAHGVFTEGLALPFLIFQIGAFVRIVDRRRLSSFEMIVYHLSLLLATLARYNFVLFGALLPCYGLIRFAVERRAFAATARRLMLGTGLWVAVLVAAQLLQAAYCDYFGLPSTSTAGEPGSYRMMETGKLLSGPDRQRFIERMQSATADPAVRFAIDRMVSNPNPWLATRDEIAASPLLRGRDPDAVMDTAFAIFLTTYEPASAAQMIAELHDYFFPDQGQYSFLLTSSRQSIDIYRKDDAKWPTLSRIGYLTSPLIYRYEELLSNSFIHLLDAISPGALAVVLGALALLSSLLRWCRRNTGSAIAALIASGILYVVASAFATIVLPRYIAPLYSVFWVGGGFLISELADVVVARVVEGNVRDMRQAIVE